MKLRIVSKDGMAHTTRVECIETGEIIENVTAIKLSCDAKNIFWYANIEIVLPEIDVVVENYESGSTQT